MATVTPNFNWPVPTSTDLVKDGATAIEALGDSIDASLVDLKGGTTGQVLSKTSNTDMDFTWVAADDTNAIQNTIVDAKGDLIAASAADTPARLAVGNNGETLVADSSATTGLRWQPSQAAGRNYVINGSYEIWQRGTSFAISGGIPQYCSDRWQGYSPNLGRTVTRQGALATGYYARVARDSGNSLTGLIYYGTTLESQNTVNLIGKTVTMSFSARAGANYSGGTLSAYVVYGTGTNENLFAGLTGQTTVVTSNVTLTTSFQQFTLTGTVNAAATQMAVYFLYAPTGTAGAADYFEVDDVQLELGSVATTFTPAGGTIAGELAACQRYYIRYSSNGDSNFDLIGPFGSAAQTTQVFIPWNTPTMRTAASAVDYANLRLSDNSGGTPAISNLVLIVNSNPTTQWIEVTTTGATAYRPYTLQANNNATAYIGFSAEL